MNQSTKIDHANLLSILYILNWSTLFRPSRNSSEFNLDRIVSYTRQCQTPQELVASTLFGRSNFVVIFLDSSSVMAAPLKKISVGPQDAYNFGLDEQYTSFLLNKSYCSFMNPKLAPKREPISASSTTVIAWDFAVECCPLMEFSRQKASNHKTG